MTSNDNAQDAKPPRQMRSRFKAQSRSAMWLEECDLKLLCDLFLHRLMSRGQLERVYFTSASGCNVRLRQMFDPPPAPYGAQCIYTLGKTGMVPVARRLSASVFFEQSVDVSGLTLTRPAAM